MGADLWVLLEERDDRAEVFTIWTRARRLEIIDRARVGRTLGVFVAIILVATPVAHLLPAVLGAG